MADGDGPHLDCSDGLQPAQTHRDDPAIWLFSGGTTGRPKAAVQTHGSFANTTELYAQRAMGWREDDITLSVPKLYFGYATGSNLFFPLLGRRLRRRCSPSTRRPRSSSTGSRRHRPTILINTPKMVAAMIELAAPAGPAPTSPALRFATSAGEALPAVALRPLEGDLRRRALRRAGHGRDVARLRLQPARRRAPRHPRQVGAGLRAARSATPTAATLPDGEVGRLWVRGDSRALGYWQDSAKSAEAFRGEWFASGDLRAPRRRRVRALRRPGRRRPQGRRAMVRCPAEVEDCLLAHAGGDAKRPWSACRTAAASPARCAFVVARRTGATAWTRHRCSSTASPSSTPTSTPAGSSFVDDFPRTHLGKVDRGALRRLADGQL